MPYPNWKMGEKLLGSAVHCRLFRDRAYLLSGTPALRRIRGDLGAQIDRSRNGLLGRERYSSDIPDQVYGLHSQAVVWQACAGWPPAWDADGPARARPALPRTRRRGSARPSRGGARVRAPARPTARCSSRSRLLDGEPAVRGADCSRRGELLEPRDAVRARLRALPARRRRGARRSGGTCEPHGSRLLGLVRAGAFALYKTPRFPVSGTDQVYGLNVSRFLAENDEPDQLVLSLYGQLAARDDAGDVRRRRGRVRRAAPGAGPPLDVPAAELAPPTPPSSRRCG